MHTLKFVTFDNIIKASFDNRKSIPWKKRWSFHMTPIKKVSIQSIEVLHYPKVIAQNSKVSPKSITLRILYNNGKVLDTPASYVECDTRKQQAVNMLIKYDKFSTSVPVVITVPSI